MIELDMNSSQSQNRILSYQKAVSLLLEKENQRSWLEWCIEKNIYHFYTEEYVSVIARKLKDIDKSLRNKQRGLKSFNGSTKKIIEVAAGSGVLSSGLRENGIDVLPTDINPPNEKVKKFSAEEVLRKYKPEIVIACWLPIDSNIELKILTTKSVRYFLYVCQSVNGAAGNERIWSAQDWEVTPLPEADKFSLSRYDFVDVSGNIIRHSKTFMLKKDYPFRNNI